MFSGTKRRFEKLKMNAVRSQKHIWNQVSGKSEYKINARCVFKLKLIHLCFWGLAATISTFICAHLLFLFRVPKRLSIFTLISVLLFTLYFAIFLCFFTKGYFLHLLYDFSKHKPNLSIIIFNPFNKCDGVVNDTNIIWLKSNGPHEIYA